MSSQFENVLKEKSLFVACDITGRFYTVGYGGMGMDFILPAVEDVEVVILSLIEKGVLLQKEGVRHSFELGLDLKYYDYQDS